MISIFDLGYAVLDNGNVFRYLSALNIGKVWNCGSHIIECLDQSLLGNIMDA
jgi:hypothetical protein